MLGSNITINGPACPAASGCWYEKSFLHAGSMAIALSNHRITPFILDKRSLENPIHDDEVTCLNNINIASSIDLDGNAQVVVNARAKSRYSPILSGLSQDVGSIGSFRSMLLKVQQT